MLAQAALRSLNIAPPRGWAGAKLRHSMKRLFAVLAVPSAALLFSLSLNTAEAQSKKQPPRPPAAQPRRPLLNQTPAAAAKRLYDAWKQNNASAAVPGATRRAVDDLFAAEFRPMNPDPSCVRIDGGYECVYRDAEPADEDAFDISFYVVNGTVSGYGVDSLAFWEPETEE